MSVLEITGFICGIAGIYLTLKENIWCFPIGLLNVLASLVLFFNQKLYADAVQQIVYCILLSYGWYEWLHGDNNSALLKISKSSLQLLLICLAIWIGGTLLSGYLLEKFTDAAMPWPDSAATMLSFIAQWMIARKKLENWLLWLFVNVFYIFIYLYKGLDLYACLFAIYFFMAIWGYTKWRSEMETYEKA